MVQAPDLAVVSTSLLLLSFTFAFSQTLGASELPAEIVRQLEANEGNLSPLDGNPIPRETFDLTKKYTRSGTQIHEWRFPEDKEEQLVRTWTLH